MDICLGVEKRLEDGTLPLRLTSCPSNRYVALHIVVSVLSEIGLYLF